MLTDLRRMTSGFLLAAIVSLSFTACAPPAPGTHATRVEAAAGRAAGTPSPSTGDGDPDDGLTVKSGSELSYVEILDGIFADDADALDVALATLTDYSDTYRAIVSSGDPHGGRFDGILTAPMERQVREYLARTVDGPGEVGGPITVEDAFVIQRFENGGTARVHFAYCRVDHPEAGAEPSVTTRRRELAVSAVSTADEPRLLRLEAILEWVGEPFCAGNE